MLKHLLLNWVTAITGVPFRVFTKDVDPMAFTYRMGAGYPGDVNRVHPASIEPNLIAVATPPTGYGQAVVAAAANAGVRPFAGGDAGLTKLWGATVRPYPTSPGGTVTAPGASAAFGSATPPASGEIDVLRSGYIMVKIPAAEAALAAKGGAVFVRCAVAGADDPIGGFKAQADGGNTAALDTYLYTFNGPADASGNVELCLNI